MDISAASILSIALGIGLAAATGFRVFLPFLVVAIAAREGWMPINESFAWLASNTALIMLASAAILETLAYFVPGIDHALDLIAAPAAVVAGVIVSAAAMINMPPSIVWPLAIIAGGGVAGLTKGSAALIRTKTGITTAGLGNPVVSTGETIGATAISILAIAVPMLCLVVVVALSFWGVRRLVRARVGARE